MKILAYILWLIVIGCGVGLFALFINLAVYRVGWASVSWCFLISVMVIIVILLAVSKLSTEDKT